MKIDYRNFYTLWGEALESTDRERYISEWTTSEIFYSNPEQPGPDMLEVADTLDNIWITAHMEFVEFRQQAGLTQVDFAKLLCVPRRTLENWESRNRGSCPSYFQLMIAKMLDILKVEIEYPSKR
ncbi:MAG TPA: helix-turn-helix transcriptional regulator [Candidatus Onthovicinus excrementipullorum]|nr:helix-turn-helix transcriptional regulator [Candidatus Onthovicinus excrementipullorum]